MDEEERRENMDQDDGRTLEDGQQDTEDTGLAQAEEEEDEDLSADTRPSQAGGESQTEDPASREEGSVPQTDGSVSGRVGVSQAGNSGSLTDGGAVRADENAQGAGDGAQETGTASAGGQGAKVAAMVIHSHRARSLLRRIDRDQQRILSVKSRMESYREEIQSAITTKKQEEARQKLDSDSKDIAKVEKHLAVTYPAKTEELPKKRYQELARNRMGELARHTEAAVSLYQDHQKTLTELEPVIPLQEYDDRLTQINEERRSLKYREGEVSYYEYRSLRSRFEDLEAEAANLPEVDTPKGREIRSQVDTHLEKERIYLKALERRLSVDDQEKLERKEQESEESQSRLNTRYKRSDPLIRLLFKVRKVKDVSKPDGAFKETVGEMVDDGKGIYELYEGFSGVKEAREKHKDTLAGVEKKEEESKVKRWLVDHAKTGLAWLMGGLGADEAQKEAGGNVLEALAEWFKPLVSAGKLFVKMVKYVSAIKNMTWAEAKDKASEILGESLEAVSDTMGQLFEKLKIVPLFEYIASLVKGAAGIIQNVIRLVDTKKLKKTAWEKKEALKRRMAEKRAKYAAMADTRGEDLYGFMGTSEERHGLFWRKSSTELHVAKEDSAKSRFKKNQGTSTTIQEQRRQLEEDAGEGDLYEQLADMKQRKNRGQLDAAEKKRYYRLKVLRDIREYMEHKESSSANKKRLRAQGMEIANSAMDMVAGISGLFPGYGTAVATGISLFQATVKFGKTAAGKVKGMWDEHRGNTARKDARREYMAEDMLNRMEYVTGFMSKDEESEAEPLFHVGLSSAKNVWRHMEYLSSITTTLNYQMSEMHKAKSREKLLEQMAEAFSAG